MFSSLTSFLFGSNTNCETNSERTTATATATGLNKESDTSTNLVDADDNLEVILRIPSVIKRGKNKRNNARQQNKRKENKTPLTANTKQTKVLTSHNSREKEEEELVLNEDEWCILELEEEKRSLTPTHTDSEEENVPEIEVAEDNNQITSAAVNTLTPQRRYQHINLHSLYSGPRPQKHRNFYQKTRNNKSNRPSNGLSVSTLSPSRTVNDGCLGSQTEDTADAGVTRSLYMTSSLYQANDETISSDAVNKMEESTWFITPPSCFTSIGPVVMETSPYENLLIEHPSMSVYHSIKKAQEAAESFIKLDLSDNDAAEKQKATEATPKKVRKNSQVLQPRNAGSIYLWDRQCVTQLKQEVLARNEQKVQIKQEKQDICRSAIKRTNKVRDVQSRNHVQRRSDRQHSKVCSNANNNRKTNCY